MSQVSFKVFGWRGLSDYSPLFFYPKFNFLLFFTFFCELKHFYELFYERIFDKTFLAMSNNIPNEILLDIFRNLDRNEVEKCQLISPKWNSIVNNNSLSLRKIYSMNIGRKYATSSASEEELFVSLTLYDK